MSYEVYLALCRSPGGGACLLAAGDFWRLW